MPETTDPQAMVEAVMNILAPKVDAGELAALGFQPQRWPIFRFDYEGHAVMPSDGQVRALAEQIVTAIRTATRQPEDDETEEYDHSRAKEDARNAWQDEEPDDPPEPGFDPGPEVDDQGGMSEHRYLTAPEDRP